MKKLIPMLLVVGCLFLSTNAMAQVRGTVTNVLNTGQDIVMTVEYTFDGKVVSTQKFRINPEDLEGRNKAQIITYLTDKVERRAHGIIKKMYIEQNNVDVVDNKLDTLVGKFKDLSVATFDVDTDDDLVADLRVILTLTGSTVVRTTQPITP